LKNVRLILRKNSFGVAVLHLTSSIFGLYTAVSHIRILILHESVNSMAQFLRIHEPIKMKTKRDGDSATREGEKKMKGYRMRPWLSIGAALLGSFLIYMVPGVVSAACEDPPAPQVNWANCNKKSATLVNADLRGANLRQTNFMGAALGNINLQGADLTEANLLSANLSNANLSQAVLTKANLHGAVAVRTNFHNAELMQANLRRAMLRKANLTGANLSEANLSEAELSGAVLTKANLSGAKLKQADLGGVDLADVVGLTPEQLEPALKKEDIHIQR
jgi:hypothetical protein